MSVEFAVSDGGPNVYLPKACEPCSTDPQTGAILISPFDNLLWDRIFVRRIFGFDHLIEAYKQQHRRVYGYYVLPLLIGDRLVGRIDLKADRHEGLLRAKVFHIESYAPLSLLHGTLSEH